jgi:hypothetical protein
LEEPKARVKALVPAEELEVELALLVSEWQAV